MIAALAATLTLFAGAADAPKCYGAAARDTEKPCVSTTKRVTPTPDQAAITPNVACVRGDLADSCTYGSAEPVATVALLGDSHAAHWRAALQVLAQQRRWRVVEFARPHCPFSFSEPAPTEAGASDCVAFNQRVIEWLAANPSVATVFVSNNSRLPMAQRGISARVRGHLAAFAALPESVQRIFALRDTPTVRVTTPDCIRKALAARVAPGGACSIPRRRALVVDATTIAAERMSYRGGRVIDLSSFFCDRRECFPVVGGVLVHKDQDHLTQRFSATLGPYIGRALDQAG
ncbi:hypothetical protein DVA67_024570 [Solirubrobacter sp. CPCC 204708]|uniref:SGNH hydrolase domain-containing protein n=1 Tax=Solirubrobacter deserti TaxID=2282478 RepID=A0ABT4RUE2_9ACTN|nr:SGNH hydrolase domain-containing protein [Solirubrobacter deserti]MBE2319173.1 hypothetical protein [Solirubrobacter deserti]MDA0142199.1 SGNH hydrolase domain-containing protein [Solirubrobacter deserti]